MKSSCREIRRGRGVAGGRILTHSGVKCCPLTGQLAGMPLQPAAVCLGTGDHGGRDYAPGHFGTGLKPMPTWTSLTGWVISYAAGAYFFLMVLESGLTCTTGNVA